MQLTTERSVQRGNAAVKKSSASLLELTSFSCEDFVLPIRTVAVSSRHCQSVSRRVRKPTLSGRLIFTILFICAAWFASGAPIQFQSEATQTPLLELYTSEGCSSCPPAETWLSRLKENPKLWKDFVPVAFHVDYWDYLGWKDPFATAGFTERQRNYAAYWRNRSVYTPGFVMNGKEWSNRKELSRASSISVGVLSASSTDGKQWTLRFQPAAGNVFSSGEFHAALLGFELISDVKAGENGGRKLEHDFVVLTLANAAASKDGEGFQVVLSLDAKLSVPTKHLAFVAWVTPAKSPQSAQALGGWLAAPK